MSSWAACKKPGLLDLNDVLRSSGFDFFDARFYLPGERIQRFGMRRVLAFEDSGLTRVAAPADVGIEFHIAKESQVKLLGCPLSAAFRKNVDLVLAVRADEITHVLNQPDNVYLHLAEHLDRFARVLQRHVGRSGDHDRPG